MTGHRRDSIKLTGLSVFAALAFAACLRIGTGRSATFETSTVDDPTVAAEINQLNGQIKDKQASVDGLHDRISAYKAEIAKKESEAASLDDQIGLLENRAAKTELDIEGNMVELDLVAAQVQVLDKQVRAHESQLERQKLLMAELIRSMDSSDGDVLLQALFSSESVADLFDRLQQLADVNEELASALERARAERDQLLVARTDQEGKRARLASIQETLLANRRQLELEKGAKESLLAESQASEAQFRAIVASLREEEAYVAQQIAALQGDIQEKLDATDIVGDSSVMSWPVDAGYRGISTLFHDPTYPFRRLFEHSGLDIPQPQGTPVGAASPGYVAWTRVGSMYGNYVMVIHRNGLATLYAHLSKVKVKADQFVARGETIGLSGGMPGTSGAGLSTGPHLHFEVRKGGIPVDPMPFMISKP
ncbi:hypothetical protein EPO34_01010 [Patescibacteria group bacterium]|nr:MAG: hypothetical protein EPO34_01010 [Patescibacteria group bacterium]